MKFNFVMLLCCHKWKYTDGINSSNDTNCNICVRADLNSISWVAHQLNTFVLLLVLIAGSVLVLVSFPPLFAPCPGCTNVNPNSTSWLMAVYYAALIIVFQAGWAIVQISHLALIPDLAPTQQGRAELTAIR